MAKHNQYRFQGHSGYIIHFPNASVGHHLISLGHTAWTKPWSDPDVHQHEYSEEYYFLRKGMEKF